MSALASIADDFAMTLGWAVIAGKYIWNDISNYFSGNHGPSGSSTIQFYAAAVSIQTSPNSNAAVLPYSGQSSNEFNAFLGSLLTRSYGSITTASEALSKVGNADSTKILWLVTQPGTTFVEDQIRFQPNISFYPMPPLTGRTSSGQDTTQLFDNKVACSRIEFAENNLMGAINFTNNGGGIVLNAVGLNKLYLSDTNITRNNSRDGSSQEYIFNVDNSNVYSSSAVFRYFVYGNVNERPVSTIFSIRNNGSRELSLNSSIIDYHYDANNYVGENSLFRVNDSNNLRIDLGGSLLTALVRAPNPQKALVLVRGDNSNVRFEHTGTLNVGAPTTSTPAALRANTTLNFTLFESEKGTIDAEFDGSQINLFDRSIRLKTTNDTKSNKVSYNAVILDENTRPLLSSAYKYSVFLPHGEFVSNSGVARPSRNVDGNYMVTADDYSLFVINRRGISIVLPAPTTPGRTYRIIKKYPKDNVILRSEVGQIEQHEVYTLPKDVKILTLEAIDGAWEVTEWNKYL